MHRISARAALLRPAPLAELAARDPGVRAALARTLDRYGDCDTECWHVLLARPAVLCPGCTVPAGGAAVLLTAHASSEGLDVEVAAWAAAEGLAGGPALARLDERSACWGRAECAVALALEDAEAREVARHASVLLLDADPIDSAPLWAPPPGPS